MTVEVGWSVIQGQQMHEPDVPSEVPDREVAPRVVGRPRMEEGRGPLHEVRVPLTYSFHASA